MHVYMEWLPKINYFFIIFIFIFIIKRFCWMLLVRRTSLKDVLLRRRRRSRGPTCEAMRSLQRSRVTWRKQTIIRVKSFTVRSRSKQLRNSTLSSFLIRIFFHRFYGLNEQNPRFRVFSLQKSESTDISLVYFRWLLRQMSITWADLYFVKREQGRFD